MPTSPSYPTPRAFDEAKRASGPAGPFLLGPLMVGPFANSSELSYTTRLQPGWPAIWPESLFSIGSGSRLDNRSLCQQLWVALHHLKKSISKSNHCMAERPMWVNVCMGKCLDRHLIWVNVRMGNVHKGEFLYGSMTKWVNVFLGSYWWMSYWPWSHLAKHKTMKL